MVGLLEKRLLFVTGKGGTGKSSVAAALGLTAARRGRRTIVAEVAQRDQAARALGAAPGAEPSTERQLADNLWAISVDPQQALEEYLADQLPVRALAEALGHSRTFGYFAAATPGMAELLTVGKLWELAQPQRRRPGASGYDLVVVDAPASGHGVGILRTPATFASVARVGPVGRHARIIAATLTDPALTGIIAVARPQEIPVAETIELQRELRRQLGLELDMVVANGVAPTRFSAREAAAMDRAASGLSDGPSAAALAAARTEHARGLGQRAQLARLRRATGQRPVRLPLLAVPRELGLEGCRQLSRALEPALVGARTGSVPRAPTAAGRAA